MIEIETAHWKAKQSAVLTRVSRERGKTIDNHDREDELQII
jgi:hypothetical protein